MLAPVDILMSASTFAQAKVLTSHKKAVMTVITKSYKREVLIIKLKNIHEYTKETKAETASIKSPKQLHQCKQTFSY